MTIDEKRDTLSGQIKAIDKEILHLHLDLTSMAFTIYRKTTEFKKALETVQNVVLENMTNTSQSIGIINLTLSKTLMAVRNIEKVLIANNLMSPDQIKISEQDIINHNNFQIEEEV